MEKPPPPPWLLNLPAAVPARTLFTLTLQAPGVATWPYKPHQNYYSSSWATATTTPMGPDAEEEKKRRAEEEEIFQKRSISRPRPRRTMADYDVGEGQGRAMRR